MKDRYVLGFLFAAFLLKICYILNFTTFQTSVYFDMGAYWGGAYQHAWGDQNSFNQYAIFPPFYSYLLSYLLKIIDSMDITGFSLSLAIILQTFLHTFASYFVYRIVRQLTGQQMISCLALLFYVFSYTGLCVGALILPDNFSTAILVIVTGMVLVYELTWINCALIGVLLGTAIAAKPSFVVFTPVFLIYIFLTATKRYKLLTSIVFSLCVVMIPLTTVIENYRISGGNLKSLGANGGVNFLEGWGEVGKINSNSEKGYYWVYSPGALDEPTWKPIEVSEPFYKQGYFYTLGLKAIQDDPMVLIRKFTWFSKLFFGPLVPSLIEQPSYYNKIMPVVQFILLAMFLFMGIVFLFLKHIQKAKVLFLLAILGTFLVSIYLIGMPERRYLLYMEFIIVILFFTAVSQTIRLYLIHQAKIIYYLGGLVLILFLPLLLKSLFR